MTIHIIAFGIAKDILQTQQMTIEVPEAISVQALKELLHQQYPEFEKLASLKVAIHTEYQAEDAILQADDEVVLIPPVSGG